MQQPNEWSYAQGGNTFHPAGPSHVPDHEINWYPTDDFVLTQEWIVPSQSAPTPSGAHPPREGPPTQGQSFDPRRFSNNVRATRESLAGDAESRDTGRVTSLEAAPQSVAPGGPIGDSSLLEQGHPSRDPNGGDKPTLYSAPLPVQPRPTGIPSTEYIAPSGMSLRRGMACRFCRRRKLRCSGERPQCASCLKYKQTCVYQPHVSKLKSHIPDPRAGKTCSFFTEGMTGAHCYSSPAEYNAYSDIPSQPAFSSQPLAFDDSQLHRNLNVQPYSYEQGSQGQQPYPQYPTAPPPHVVPALTGSYNEMPMDTAAGQSFNPWNPISTQQPTFTSTYAPLPAGEYLPQTHGEHGLPLGSSSALSPRVQYTSNPPEMVTHTTTIPPTDDAAQQIPPRSSTQSTEMPPPNYVYPVGPPARSVSFDQSRSRYSSVTESLPSHQHGPRDSSASTTNPSASASASPPVVSSSGPEMITRMIPDPDHTAEVGSLTARLGEFLLCPGDRDSPALYSEGDDPVEWTKKSRKESSQWTSVPTPGDTTSGTALFHNTLETDGLRDEHRNLLLDLFLSHCRLFFEMSIPRFRYRMTFQDHRRPSLALLNGMYLWATRMSNKAELTSMEEYFYSQAHKYLEIAAPSSDRLLDSIRAAMLLCCYSYANGRHHEGWLMAGLAMRLVMSTGLHQIPSLIFRPPPTINPFLRNKVPLLPPPEDAIELAERVHAFWCVYAVERCGALATGFPSVISDADISTPFGLPLDLIASQVVTAQDDVTILDLYRGQVIAHPEGDAPYVRWIKALTILERASKLAFLSPAPDSEYTLKWTQYASSIPQQSSPPPEWLNQPKFRNPKDYDDCARALKQYTESLGEDGLWPLDRRRAAEADRVTMPSIRSHTILLHFQMTATEMLLHDINSLDVENVVAVKAARRCAELISQLPPLALNEVDAQVVLVWTMVAKLLIKEVRRCVVNNLVTMIKPVEDDIDVIIQEIARVGSVMYLARVQSKALEEHKRAALRV
ncbi:hypothetical protein IAU60_001771 [Kwoniella sp. DSM 27419]